MTGGEWVLEALRRMYPKPTFSRMFWTRWPFLRSSPPSIKTTFIHRLPGSKKHYQRYLPLIPLALEQIDLADYELTFSASPARPRA